MVNKQSSEMGAAEDPLWWVKWARARPDDVDQRTAEWHVQRFEAITTGSVLFTVLGKNPYPDRDHPCPPGVDQTEWNKEILFRRQTCQIPDTKQTRTGNLYADHMWRGTVLEPAIACLLSMTLDAAIVDMPSIPVLDGDECVMRISPDGLVLVYNLVAEFKAPMKARTLACSTHPDGHPCCDVCIAAVLGIYADQVQGELAAVAGARAAFFTQLRTREFVEMLGFRDGDEGGADVAARVREFVKDPARLLGDRRPGEFLYTIVVPKDDGWLARVLPTVREFNARVRAERALRGVTSETYCTLNGIAR